MHEQIQSNQFLLLHGSQCPLSKEELKATEVLADNLKYESITAGDAGDKHKLKVGRFKRDIDMPEEIDPSCKDLMKIINSDKMKSFYRQLTTFQDICIRRAQANLLGEGDYVGVHIDGEGSSKYQGTHIDYKYAVVLHFGLTYEAGDTVIYPNNEKKQLRLPEYSMFIITGSLPHEVSPVASGTRKTIAYFLSDNHGRARK